MDANATTSFRLHPDDDHAPASQSRPISMWRLILLAASLVALVALPALAQQANQPEPMEVMSRAWTAFYQQKYQDAVKLAEPLTNLRDAHVRNEALHCIARCCWAADTRQSRERARSIWLTMERNFSSRSSGFALVSDSLGRRVLIGQAVMLASEGKQAEAMKKLEPFRTISPIHSDPAISEALIFLAELHVPQVPAAGGVARPSVLVDAKRFEEAEKCLAQAEAYLKAQVDLTQGGELNKTITGPFEGAIKSARKRLADTKKETLTPGLPFFEKAQQLRRQQKWAEAAALYRKVVELEPQADYAHQSGYLIGVCTLGLKRPDMAARQWEQFIAATPAGPHRGSAFVALADLYLDELMDLTNAGKYADLARSALPTALDDEKAAPSWKANNYDIQLRLGLINLCLGRGDIAAESFAAAKKLTTNKLTAEGLDALIAAAKTGKPVIPEDCLATPAGGAQPPSAVAASPSAKVAVALSMGVVYSCSGRLDKADAYFERVLGKPSIPAKPGLAAIPPIPPMPGATKAQHAFAIFGQGAVLHARRTLDEAKEAFVESYKAFLSGTWHDETLYRIATIIQTQAEAKFPATPSPSTGEGRGEGPARHKSKEQFAKEAKAEQERIAARLLARGEATPYWEEILKRSLVKGDDGKLVPRSGRVEDALYNLGILQYDLADAGIDAAGKPLPPDKLDAAWKSAANMLGRLCELYPKSMMAGDAYIRQVDIALEKKFALDVARKYSALGMTWYQTSDAQELSTPSAWAKFADADVPAKKAAAYELSLRSGIVAYLDGQYDDAIKLLSLGEPEQPTAQFVPRLLNLDRVGLSCLLIAARERRVLTDSRVLESAGNDSQRLALRLADMYLEAIRPQKAAAILSQLIEKNPSLGHVPLDTEGYAGLQLAVALDRIPSRRPESLMLLERMAHDSRYTGSDWGGCSLFRLALFTYNQTQNPRLSIPLYQRMLTEYPRHEYTELAHLYCILDLVQSDDAPLAKSMADDFLERYPTSKYATGLRNALKRLERHGNKGEQQ